MRSEVLESGATEGWRLRVEFLWHIDRYRHVISAIDPAGGITPLLESIEGTRADNWPPSPPLQSLHLEKQPGGSRVALLVGMAGKSHWSASIGPGSVGPGLVFDLACRAGSAAGNLGSQYRIASGVQRVTAEADAIRLEVGDRAVTISGSSAGTTLTALHAVTGQSFVAQPSSLSSGPTRRWLYSIALTVPSTEY